MRVSSQTTIISDQDSRSPNSSRMPLNTAVSILTNKIISVSMAGCVIESQITDKIPFIPTEENRKRIHKNIVVVATNIPSESIDEVLAQSRVILLGEKYLVKSNRKDISSVINNFDSSQSQLLLGNVNDASTRFPELIDRTLLTKAKPYIAKTTYQNYSQFYSESLLPIFSVGLNLLTCWLQALKEEPIPVETAKFILDCDADARSTGNVTIHSFKKAATAWTAKYEKTVILQREWQIHTFKEESTSLFEILMKETQTTSNKIFAISSFASLVKTERYTELAELLQEKMKASSIPFVILASRKDYTQNISPESLFDIKDLRKYIIDEFKGKIFEASFIELHLQKMKAKDRMNSTDKDNDLIQIFAFILSLEYMKI